MRTPRSASSAPPSRTTSPFFGQSSSGESGDSLPTMLIELSVRNLAIFSDVRVPFSPGLNIGTGGRGAGPPALPPRRGTQPGLLQRPDGLAVGRRGPVAAARGAGGAAQRRPPAVAGGRAVGGGRVFGDRDGGVGDAPPLPADIRPPAKRGGGRGGGGDRPRAGGAPRFSGPGAYPGRPRSRGGGTTRRGPSRLPQRLEDAFGPPGRRGRSLLLGAFLGLLALLRRRESERSGGGRPENRRPRRARPGASDRGPGTGPRALGRGG